MVTGDTPEDHKRYLHIDPTRQPDLCHRSGWAYALAALAPLHHPDGILLDSFLERTFSWFERSESRRGRIPYEEPWIGILHNPPGVPEWHDVHNAPQAILGRESFLRSLPHCRGLFVLSDYLRDWLSPRVPVPVRTLIHPTEIPALRFTADRFLANPRPAVLQIGCWLRRLSSIYQLRSGRYRKQILCVQPEYFERMFQRERSRSHLSEAQLASVEIMPFVDDAEYDRLLSENVVLCDLIDSSANNTIVECVVRDTPILINRLPAVEEYLGRDYPLFFSTLDEAAAKLARHADLVAAHEYLRRLPKGRFSQQAFRAGLAQSDIYQGLSEVFLDRRRATPEGASRPHCRTVALGEDGRELELALTLMRDASGTVYVERAEFRANGGAACPRAGRGLERLLCGQPLSAVRRLTAQQFLQQVEREAAWEARLAHDALARALRQL